MGDTKHSFHIVDYVVFGATILISLGIGLYFALSGGRQRTTSEFLVGGRAMKFLPVAVSLMVSFESSIMMLGTPAEVYVYGAQVWIALFGFLASFLICRVLMIPLIHPLKITSAYEYLDGRFKSRHVRHVGTTLGILTYVFYMGIVLFGPAIALEAVTGFPQSGSIFLVAAAAIMYTAMGGLKAVIWTDVFQALVMFAGMFAIIIKGTMDAGGIKTVWTTAAKGGRLNFFNFDMDPTVRHTFWGLFLGTFARSSGLIFNQSTIQRVCSTPTLAEAKKVMLIVSPAFWITITLAMIEGIVAYAYYVNVSCDPLESGQIHNPNQIIPFMVMDIFQGLPGMPGLFLAALFSASLSTISSGLSSLSAMTWEDILKPRLPNISELTATVIAKVSVVLFGILSCGVALLISLIGGTLTQITTTVLSAFNGPLCGLFILASLCPWANAKGAVISTVVSTVVMMWLCAGSTFSGATRPTPWLTPAPTDQCSVDNMTSLIMNTTGLMTSTAGPYDVTTVADVVEPVTGFNVIYTLSYTWLGALGIAIVLIVGFLVSWATGFNKDGDLDPRYVIFLSEVVRNILNCRKNTKTDEKSVRQGSIYNTEIDIEPGLTTETELPLLTDTEKDKPVSHLPSHIKDEKDEHKP
ncbi:sodium-coupled monocarboxylate transporter 1-like [Haliotis cracherodii]|uniref:sodium-coupled monocarboxylate transporter 1-like n=1 Tax=Haliotis cracherodii TaxID=6455 RepID=UPI0039EB4E1E